MKILKFIKGLIELVRPINMIITALSVWVGGILAASEDVKLNSVLILSAVAAALVAAGGNSINDAYDEDVDEFNRPDRPIPSGRVNQNFAIAWGGILTIKRVVGYFRFHQLI